MAIVIDEEVVDDCEAANYVLCTALASVLYTHVGCVPSVEFLKAPTSNVGLEELLLDGVVVDGQAPLQADLNGCRCVVPSPSSHASNSSSYGGIQRLQVASVGSEEGPQHSWTFPHSDRE
jgi:hypothetical protein